MDDAFRGQLKAEARRLVYKHTLSPSSSCCCLEEGDTWPDPANFDVQPTVTAEHDCLSLVVVVYGIVLPV